MSKITLLSVGDIILGPSPVDLFEHVNSVLQAADITMGQLEVPYTDRDTIPITIDRRIKHLDGLKSAGFDIVTFAGNHISDAGVNGIQDTIEWLEAHKIAYTGGGLNLDHAKRPAILERSDTKLGFLDYNCVGPNEMWATHNRPGCAYVHIITHYELDYATPGGPPTIYTWAVPKSLKAMQDDIQQLRETVDVVIVSLHKGLGHTPIKLADYEQQVSYAAIDAGADLVVSHHAHILHGIETYKGKVIFHGLGNFGTYLPFLAPQKDDAPDSWASRRREIFGFEPDPEYPTYPFHPEAIYTIIAKCIIETGEIKQVAYIPSIVNKQAQPEIVTRNNRGQEVFDYVKAISKGAALSAQFSWQGNEIIIE